VAALKVVEEGVQRESSQQGHMSVRLSDMKSIGELSRLYLGG
jgi:hypothetical protein